MKRLMKTKAGALLLLLVLIRQNCSIAQMNVPGSPPSATSVVARILAETNTLPVLVKITSEPSSKLFESYEGEGRNFRMNFLSSDHVNYASEVGAEVRNHEATGLFVKRFERKIALKTMLSVTQEVDVSELTLQREGEPPIVLVLKQVWEGREDVAWVLCGGENFQRPVRRYQPFSCGDTFYRVVQIGTNQVSIVDQNSGARKTLIVSAPDQ